MALRFREKLIDSLQKKRNSKVLCYFTSDRPSDFEIPGLVTQLSSEPHLQIYDHLRRTGETQQIDLLLYTRGGHTDSVWPLVSIIREFSKKFSVLVPFRYHSGGTLIALGADEIVMGQAGELSPIDPTTGNQFNPFLVPDNPKTPQLPISVEDVTSYIALAKDEKKVGIKGENNLLEVFKQLTNRVHPLALGNVQRVHSQIRMLARNLLQLHMDENTEGGKIEDIVSALTEKFYSHAHAINRNEAKLLMGRIVKDADNDEEKLMWGLFEDFADETKLREKFSIKEFMGNDIEKDMTVDGAFIESEAMGHVFRTKVKILQRSALPPNVQIQMQPGQAVPLLPGYPTEQATQIISQGWIPTKNETQEIKTQKGKK